MKREAPWTDAELEYLKQWQTGMMPLPDNEDVPPILREIGGQPVHPYMCPSAVCPTPQDDKKRCLVPSHNGWTCHCGKYIQNWAHMTLT